jgi:phage gp45-like
MHRATPVNTSFRSYSSGGARSVVDKVDDSTLMQEMAGNFMKGETRDKVESPQNYGFSSVVQAAKKGADGQIAESAEAFIQFVGGNRSFPVCGIMDDRRFRPMGLKPGENSQYDDLGQMTLLRRTGLYLLSLDSEDESQQQSGQGKAGDSGGQSKTVERMVSLRHVEKKKQERQKSQEQGGAEAQAMGAEAWAAKQEQIKQSHSDFKHEGETVNTEIRCTKNRIEFRAGDKVVGYFDVKDSKWYFEADTIHSKANKEVKDEAPKISHN